MIILMSRMIGIIILIWVRMTRMIILMVRMMANGAIILDPNTKTSKFSGNIFLVTKKK